METRLREWSPKAVCLITGHVPFRAYFRRFNLKNTDPGCECEEGPDDGNHAMRECGLPRRARARDKFAEDQARRGAPYPFIVTSDTTRVEDVDAE